MGGRLSGLEQLRFSPCVLPLCVFSFSVLVPGVGPVYSAWNWTRGRSHGNTAFLCGIMGTSGTTVGMVAGAEVPPAL